ncbi:MAG: pyrimidine dimer DNA glycosylase/endonuclease V [Candidatus Izimaplasma sp.]|nr:pyrimidine dimer DNA glycosylase/endonuclease V [Candidatus Izimaplasma bacterium]
MARSWMVNPKIHCVQHLMGAHAECHIFWGILNKKKSIKGYINSNCIEINSLLNYHKILQEEMLRRNYNHNSPLDSLPDLSYLTYEEINVTVDRQKSLDMLLERCDKCRENYVQLCDNNEYIFV